MLHSAKLTDPWTKSIPDTYSVETLIAKLSTSPLILNPSSGALGVRIRERRGSLIPSSWQCATGRLFHKSGYTVIQHPTSGQRIALKCPIPKGKAFSPVRHFGSTPQCSGAACILTGVSSWRRGFCSPPVFRALFAPVHVIVMSAAFWDAHRCSGINTWYTSAG